MPIDLPGARRGHVVTRFPPEPSWSLDIGHCKAALMNQFVAAEFEGQWILRFDDTNPRACSAAYEESYLQDLPLLGVSPHRVTRASDYFGRMAEDAGRLVEAGLLYADDTPVEEMRRQRLARLPSAARDRPAADSLAAWREMQAGSAEGSQFCLRFRLQPQSENGAMRDPVAWRVVPDPPHHRTGRSFPAYPTYDYACPWLDAAEGVTHALRTLEFRDRDELYRAAQQALLRLHPEWSPSAIWEFSRIHMAFTPQAKAHQRALLAAGLVEGPDDPRLPTLRGLMRGGMHPDALRAFLLEQVTPARKETYHSWDKPWAINRRLLEPHAARHMAVGASGRVLLRILGGPEAPEPAEVVWRQGHVVRVVRHREVWLEQDDAQALAVGDEVTLLAWGNAVVTEACTDPPQQQQQQQQQHQDAQRPGPPAPADVGGGAAAQPQPPPAAAMAARLHLAGDPKASKLKVHWLPALPELLVPLALVAYGHPVTVERVSEDVDVVRCFDPSSRREARAWGDPSLAASARPGAVVQLQRKGLFVVDRVELRERGGGDGSGGGTDGPALCEPAAAAAAPRVPRVPVPAAGSGGSGGSGAPLRPADISRLVLVSIPDGRTRSSSGFPSG